MVYGQTRSGKTSRYHKLNQKNAKVNILVVRDVFQRLIDRGQIETFTIILSYLAIYNELDRRFNGFFSLIDWRPVDRRVSRLVRQLDRRDYQRFGRINLRV